MKARHVFSIFPVMLNFLYAKFRSIWRAARRGRYSVRVEKTSYGHLTAWLDLHHKKHTYSQPFGVVEQLPTLS